MKTVQITIKGRVQGVGFRPFVYRIAIKHEIVGYVKNMGGHVKIIASGTDEQIQQFLRDLKARKPPLAQIHQLEVREIAQHSLAENFYIEKSSETSRSETSYIPPDVAICEECVRDMQEGDRAERKNYPFTSCVNCGPRFTIIWKIPYDRPNTEMKHFPLCQKCLTEYQDPLDRRFHAQTTCCKNCGPRYWIQDRDGRIIAKEDDVPRVLSKLIMKGNLVAIKGIGGTHVACDARNDEAILRLREAKGDRKEKPLALMVNSLDTINKFAKVSRMAKELLTSVRRPIVLLPKKEPFPLSKFIAPGLHNVGVMLPYAGLHVLLFEHLGNIPLVMTSANFSHQPILKDNGHITKKLDFVDFFVLHDRNIHQRADDSVIKSFANDDSRLFIRRSRGYVPEPILLPKDFSTSAHLLACGAELHGTTAIGHHSQVNPSQYIGDIKNQETFEFYKEATEHLLRLFNIKWQQLDFVITDLHPTYLSTEYGEHLAREHGSELVKIQHHLAHSYSLLLDAGWTDDALILAADGMGFGLDGKIWGGEILYLPREGIFRRISHLKYVPMPGGDLATRHPARMLLSYLNPVFSGNAEELWRFMQQHHPNPLPRGQDELRIVLQQIERQINSPLTSSMGRLLDALSVLFTKTIKMTYEGEPAMKLEAFAMKGFYPPSDFDSKAREFGLPPLLEFEKNQLDVTPLFEHLVLSCNQSRCGGISFSPKLALTILYLLGSSLAHEMLRVAEELQVKAIGFSGGVAYNEPLHLMLKSRISQGRKLTWLQHQDIPPGDGGIAIGQVVAAIKETNGG